MKQVKKRPTRGRCLAGTNSTIKKQIVRYQSILETTYLLLGLLLLVTIVIVIAIVIPILPIVYETHHCLPTRW